MIITVLWGSIRSLLNKRVQRPDLLLGNNECIKGRIIDGAMFRVQAVFVEVATGGRAETFPAMIYDDAWYSAFGGCGSSDSDDLRNAAQVFAAINFER